MFKKFINNNKSIEWNILMYSILYVILFIVILTPIVIFGISKHPELSSTLTSAPETSQEKFLDLLLQIKSFLQFFLLGTVSECVRRKRSTKFTWDSLTATRLMFYFCIEMFLYTILTLMGV